MATYEVTVKTNLNHLPKEVEYVELREVSDEGNPARAVQDFEKDFQQRLGTATYELLRIRLVSPARGPIKTTP